jgi:hypothetical protein
MTSIHMATSKGTTVEMVRGVEQEVGPREDIEGPIGRDLRHGG